jgi:hypothetical protein
VSACFAHDNESLGCDKYVKFVYEPSNYQLLLHATSYTINVKYSVFLVLKRHGNV